MSRPILRVALLLGLVLGPLVAAANAFQDVKIPDEYKDMFDKISANIDMQLKLKSVSEPPQPPSAQASPPSALASAPSAPQQTSLALGAVGSQTAVHNAGLLETSQQASQQTSSGSAKTDATAPGFGLSPTLDMPMLDASVNFQPASKTTADLNAIANQAVMEPELGIAPNAPEDLGELDLGSLSTSVTNDMNPMRVPDVDPHMDQQFVQNKQLLVHYQTVNVQLLHRIYAEYNARNGMLPELHANLARLKRDAASWVESEKKKALAQIQMQKAHVNKQANQLAQLEALVKDSQAKQNYYQQELIRMQSERALQTQQPITPAVAASMLTDAEYLQRKSELEGYFKTTTDVITRGMQQIASRRQYLEMGTRWIQQAQQQLTTWLHTAELKINSKIQQEEAKIGHIKQELLQLKSLWSQGLNRKKLIQIEMNKLVLNHQLSGLRMRIDAYEAKRRRAAEEVRQALNDQMIVRRQINVLTEKLANSHAEASKLPPTPLAPPSADVLPPPIAGSGGLTSFESIVPMPPNMPPLDPAAAAASAAAFAAASSLNPAPSLPSTTGTAGLPPPPLTSAASMSVALSSPPAVGSLPPPPSLPADLPPPPV